MLALELPRDVETRLDEIVSKVGGSRTDIVVAALRSYLDDIEDIEAAERSLADIEAGRSAVVPLDDVEREFGLADRDR